MTPSTAVPYEVGSATDVGTQRDENQDALGYFTTKDGQWLLLLVCDGMGGHAGGQIASTTTVEIASRLFNQRIGHAPADQVLSECLCEANRVVFERALGKPQLKGMGTTCAALAVCGDQAYWAHVGDSRVYRIRPGLIERLTRDHSAVQRLVDGGLLTPEQAEEHPDSNVINRCIGARQTLEPETKGPEIVRAGDRFLLCTDGLCGQVEDEIIAAMAAMYPPQEAVEKLIALANDRGGNDNVSVQLLYRADAHPPTGEFKAVAFQRVYPGQQPDEKDTTSATEGIAQPASPTTAPKGRRLRPKLLLGLLLGAAATALATMTLYTQCNSDTPATSRAEVGTRGARAHDRSIGKKRPAGVKPRASQIANPSDLPSPPSVKREKPDARPFVSAAATPSLAKRLLERCYGSLPPLPQQPGAVGAGFGVVKGALRTGVRIAGSIASPSISADEQHEAGRRAVEQMRTQYGVLTDATLRERIQRTLTQLTGEGRTNGENKYSMELLASDELNAFMTPRGQGAIFAGLLRLLRDDDALAFVMAHEIAHCELGHGVAELRAWLAGKRVGGQLGSRVSLLTGQMLGATYDQDQEYEADRLATCLVYLAGAGCEGGGKALEALQAAWGGHAGPRRPSGVPGRIAYDIVETHPALEERIAYQSLLAARLARQAP